MPLFVYTAISESGVLTKGESAAATSDELVQALNARGFRVRDIRPKNTGIAFLRRNPVKADDFLLFNQEFLTLLRAGLTIPDALKLAANRPDAQALGQTLAHVLEDVRGGALLSEACGRHPDVFDTLYTSAIRTGEKTGDMPNVLARYQGYLRHRAGLRKKISQALAYPAFLLVALTVILVVLFVFVMPRFVTMYADFDAKLPWPTQILIAIVEHLPLVATALAAVFAGGWLAWYRWVATSHGRMAVDKLKETLPYFGTISHTVAVSHLARSLATLLAGGTPLVEAMRTAQTAVTNRAYAARLGKATDEVMEGRSLAQSLRDAELMPQTAIKMVEVGEASGNLDSMLAEVAQFYDEALEHRLARVMTLIEPVFMLLMGVLIGGIIVVMYLPIFHMAEVIK